MNPKTILFVCPTGYGTSKNGVDLGLAVRERGNRVSFFDVDWMPAHLRLVPKPMRGDWWQTTCVKAMNHALLTRIDREPPQIVFFLSGFQILPTTLETIAARGIRTIGYWVDDPLEHARALEKAALYDLFLTNDQDSVSRYHAAGVKSICHFPSAASESRFFPATGGTSADIVFVGTHSAFRETVLAQLTDFDLHVYVPGWKKNSSLPRHHLHNEIFGEQTNLIYNTARINLNIHNWFGRGSAMNLRLFEVPCSGGFLVTDWVAEIDGAFVDGKHLACYRDMADLRQKISYYLTNAADRQRIATAGRAHVLANHTYRQRAAQFDAWCDQLLGRDA